MHIHICVAIFAILVILLVWVLVTTFKKEPFVESNKEELYIVYSMSNSPYQEWQADLLDYSIGRSKQPGKVVRIVSDDPKYPGRKVPMSKIGQTIHTRDFSVDADGYQDINKPGGLGELRAPNDAVILLVDPDMVFLRPWDPRTTVRHGVGYGQRWIGYGRGYCEKTTENKDKCPEEDKDALMYPLAVTYGDLRKILPMYYKNSVYYKTAKDWMTEMTALVVSYPPGYRIVSEDGIGVPNDWPEQHNGDFPIAHYCQTIKDKDGKQVWSKRTYKAWETPPDPSIATNRVDREVLRILGELASRNTYQMGHPTSS